MIMTLLGMHECLPLCLEESRIRCWNTFSLREVWIADREKKNSLLVFYGILILSSLYTK